MTPVTINWTSRLGYPPGVTWLPYALAGAIIAAGLVVAFMILRMNRRLGEESVLAHHHPQATTWVQPSHVRVSGSDES